MLVDVAVTKDNYRKFVASSFLDCLATLKWTDENTALMFFVGMCANNCLCPVLSRGSYNCLRMSWKNDGYELIVWLYPDKHNIKYAIGKISDGEAEIIEAPLEEALTLVEQWATFLQQDEERDRVHPNP